MVAVIGKVIPGRQREPVAGLINYLTGPGRANEHVDQRVIAGSWPDMDLVTGGDLIAGKDDLARWLSAWDRTAQDQYGRAPARVWHLTLSVPAEDGTLTDEQWQYAAELVMERVGLHGPDAAGGGVRWVAIAHGPSAAGNDHIHIAAVLVDQLGTPRPVWNDYYAVRDVCRELEDRWALRATAPAHDGGPTAPTRGEFERAQREGLGVPTRVRLEAEVRAAAALSSDLPHLQRLLGERSIITRLRTAPSGDATGISFADPNYVDREGEPIWFRGGRDLAPDLTLPKLQARWDAAVQAPVLADAERLLAQAAARIAAGDDDAAATVWAAADHLAAVAVQLEPDQPGGRLHQAARSVAATARATPRADGQLRSLSQMLAMARAVGNGRSDLQLILATRALLQATAELRAAQARLREARAVEQAVAALTTAAVPLRAADLQRRRSDQPGTQQPPLRPAPKAPPTPGAPSPTDLHHRRRPTRGGPQL